MRRRKTQSQIEDKINVTPLIDVVLVLLIVFMLFSMNVISSLIVDLPNSTVKKKGNNTENFSITILPNGEIIVNNKTIDMHELKKLLSNLEPDSSIFIKGDKNAKYQEIINVLSTINGINSKFKRVNLVIRNG